MNRCIVDMIAGLYKNVCDSTIGHGVSGTHCNVAPGMRPGLGSWGQDLRSVPFTQTKYLVFPFPRLPGPGTHSGGDSRRTGLPRGCLEGALDGLQPALLHHGGLPACQPLRGPSTAREATFNTQRSWGSPVLRASVSPLEMDRRVAETSHGFL